MFPRPIRGAAAVAACVRPSAEYGGAARLRSRADPAAPLPPR